MFVLHFAPVKEVRAGLNYFANARRGVIQNGTALLRSHGHDGFLWGVSVACYVRKPKDDEKPY